jgi:hypothetical protein
MMFDLTEHVIESESRYRMYGTEIEAARELGMSFQDWEQLAAIPGAHDAPSGFIFIQPSEPLQLAA